MEKGSSSGSKTTYEFKYVKSGPFTGQYRNAVERKDAGKMLDEKQQ